MSKTFQTKKIAEFAKVTEDVEIPNTSKCYVDDGSTILRKMGNAAPTSSADDVRSSNTVIQSTPSVQQAPLTREKSFLKQKGVDVKSASRVSREKSVRNILLSSPVDSDIVPLVTLRDGYSQTDDESSFWLYADYWVFSIVIFLFAYYYLSS